MSGFALVGIFLMHGLLRMSSFLAENQNDQRQQDLSSRMEESLEKMRGHQFMLWVFLAVGVLWGLQDLLV